jgi:hypothetical protein
LATGAAPPGGQQAAHQRLGLAHRQGLLGDQIGHLDLLAARGQAEQRSRMAHFDAALFQ